MYARHGFNTKGYTVFYHAIPEDVAGHLRSLSRDDQNFWNHDTWYGVLHDEKRFRAFVPDSTSRALSENLQRFYLTFLPDSSVTEWQFLKTVAGAKDQLVHREFPPVTSGQDCLNAASVPGICLLHSMTTLASTATGGTTKLRCDHPVN
ncbi:hypothetical protein V7S43_009796 [Phytophthora oleae]|uniref:Uncharacterized protein n=1 Tax=Phytophthora oleae TaxID=2107226 RepID=A0ABD3FH01_9STRA